MEWESFFCCKNAKINSKLFSNFHNKKKKKNNNNPPTEWILCGFAFVEYTEIRNGHPQWTLKTITIICNCIFFCTSIWSFLNYDLCPFLQYANITHLFMSTNMNISIFCFLFCLVFVSLFALTMKWKSKNFVADEEDRECFFEWAQNNDINHLFQIRLFLSYSFLIFACIIRRQWAGISLIQIRNKVPSKSKHE